jgi:phosphinothricin acetyltransferase
MPRNQTGLREKNTTSPGIIRAALPNDAPAILEIYGPVVENTTISFETARPSIPEMTKRISQSYPMFPFLVCQINGEIVGYAYAGAHRARAAYRWSADTTVYVHQNARKRGVARQLYAELIDTLTRQGYHVAFAGIALPNEASVKLHEAMGFSHLGTYLEVGYKQGRWVDVGWWRRPLSELTDPVDPLTFAEIWQARSSEKS